MEIWKTIDWATDYEVSNLGRVKSKLRFIKTSDGDNRIVREKILKCCKATKGYVRAVISLKEKKVSRNIHRLVAEAFLERIDNKTQVNHINGIKTDNRLVNLEWCTNRENKDHAILHGLIAKGFRLPQNKFSDEVLNDIIDLKNRGVKQKDIAKKYGVKQQCVSRWFKRGNHLAIKVIRP